jgi:hypothetical protein
MAPKPEHRCTRIQHRCLSRELMKIERSKEAADSAQAMDA